MHKYTLETQPVEDIKVAIRHILAVARASSIQTARIKWIGDRAEGLLTGAAGWRDGSTPSTDNSILLQKGERHRQSLQKKIRSFERERVYVGFMFAMILIGSAVNIFIIYGGIFK